jgi:hypothetical protein
MVSVLSVQMASSVHFDDCVSLACTPSYWPVVQIFAVIVIVACALVIGVWWGESRVHKSLQLAVGAKIRHIQAKLHNAKMATGLAKVQAALDLAMAFQQTFEPILRFAVIMGGPLKALSDLANLKIKETPTPKPPPVPDTGRRCACPPGRPCTCNQQQVNVINQGGGLGGGGQINIFGPEQHCGACGGSPCHCSKPAEAPPSEQKPIERPPTPEELSNAARKAIEDFDAAWITLNPEVTLLAIYKSLRTHPPFALFKGLH